MAHECVANLLSTVQPIDERLTFMQAIQPRKTVLKKNWAQGKPAIQNPRKKNISKHNTICFGCKMNLPLKKTINAMRWR